MTPVETLLARLSGVKETGTGWSARCPAHDDRRASLSIASDDDGTVLVKCHAGCGTAAILSAVGLTLKDLFPSRSGTSRMNIVAEYNYTDADGKLLFQVVRLDPKDFRQRRPDANGKGGWIWNLKGVPRVLYRLPEVRKAVADGQTIYLCEGEKDADRLAKIGLTATTNPGGAGKWCKDYSEVLRGANVVVLPDNDEPGQAHAAKVARKLRAKATSVRIVNLPDLPPKGDESDWLAAGGSREQLEKLAAAAPPDPQPRTVVGSKEEANQGDEDDQKQKETQAQALIHLAEAAALFHDAERRAYATVEVGNHHETLPIRSGDFKRWLVRAFYRAQEKPPSATALNDALGLIEARAIYDGPQLPVSVRLAEQAGNIYSDLCNPEWEVVEITAEGWRILPSAQAPVKFRRPRGMLALPRPARGGKLDDLQKHLGIRNQRQWVLLVGFLVMAFRPRGPYPLLGLHGEQGSGKSTRARVIRSLIDPHSVPLRCEPKEPRDLMIGANNSWCIGLDNLSYLPVWLSDALCRLATGGGFGMRELYTNDEEQLFDAMRPVILTGIEAVATRPDLLDRSILLDVPPIPKEERKTEEELYAALEPDRAGILGAILDAVACALKNLPNTQLPSLPRMADFAKWVTAAEPALGLKPGQFLAAFEEGQDEANEIALDAWPIVDPLRQLMVDRLQWEGKPSELLARLGELAGEKAAKPEGWPKRANALSGQLKRLAPNLRKIGLSVTFGSAGRGKAKGRRIVIEVDKAGDSSSPPSPASPSPKNQGCGDDPLRDGDVPLPDGDDLLCGEKLQKNGAGDGGDDGDDLSPAYSNRELFEL
jgi:hypothetical protein